MLPGSWRCRHNRAVVDGPHCRMQLSDRERRALIDEPKEADSNGGGDRRQRSACRVLRLKAVLIRMERDVCQNFWQQEIFQGFDRRAQ